MWPQKKVTSGTVRIVWLVGMLVVLSVDRDPAGRRILQAADAENRERMLEPLRATKRAMRQQPVIAKIDAERPEYVGSQQTNGEPGPD